ncbi:MAG: putative integral rane protein [Cyanobacteria bacterium RYN_339]|nr:putative integral rane protein [Cyanobacteria bacterium RYN_339]
MTTNTQTPAMGGTNKGLHIGLWVAQILLAIGFGMAGWMKLTMPMAQVAAAMPGMSEALLRFIGVAEVAGALGMLLPAATRIYPVLTAWAGIGLATIMVLAGALHLVRAEFSHLPPVLVLFALASFVAWGRFKKAPTTPRGN